MGLLGYALLWVIKNIREAREEQTKQAKEIAKHEERLIKHEKRIADLEYRKAQAEIDILNEQTKLDYLTSKLSALDEEIAQLNIDIEFYRVAHKVDSEKKAMVAKAKLEDKVFSYEDKARACEKRMGKAMHIKQMAEKELCA